MKTISMLIVLGVILQENTSVICNFKHSKSTDNWFVVDDGVMGGLSKGNISINKSDNAIYKGFVTTDNNGGFSSVRHTFNEKDVSNFNFVKLRLKGDGKDYQFRIKENTYQRYSYISTFNTSGNWETIKIPLSSFYPSLRGYKLNKANYSGKVMQEIAFLIGNKTKESFALEIESIILE